MAALSNPTSGLGFIPIISPSSTSPDLSDGKVGGAVWGEVGVEAGAGLGWGGVGGGMGWGWDGRGMRLDGSGVGVRWERGGMRWDGHTSLHFVFKSIPISI